MSDLYRNPQHGRLGEMLALEEIAPDRFASLHLDENTGGEVFGGQYLGLALGAALRTGRGMMPHAYQAFFLRSAPATEQIEFVVERTREGRAFAHRRVTAMQAGRELFRAEVSLHAWEEGEASHSADIVPPHGPQGLVSMREIVAANADAVGPVTVRRVCWRDAMDYHLLEPEKGLLVQGDVPAMSGWIVPHAPPPPDDPVAFYASLAYMSDGFSNASCRMTHSLNVYAGELLSVSLNHAMWFHSRPCPIETVFCAMESPFAGGGLGWNRGAFYDAQGHLLASIVQDLLIRRPAPAPAAGASNP